MFNHITIHYSAPSPMTGVILYETDGTTIQDIIHLQPTGNATLVHPIQGAAEGKTADKFRILSLTAPRGMSPDVTLHDITLALVPTESL